MRSENCVLGLKLTEISRSKYQCLDDKLTINFKTSLTYLIYWFNVIELANFVGSSLSILNGEKIRKHVVLATKFPETRGTNSNMSITEI